MFANKVVIVTGGNGGIGAATAELFAKEGASVAIVGRNETKLKNVAERCEKLGAQVLAIKADLSKPEEVKDIVQKTIDKFGKLDVLVNNAALLKFATIFDSNVLEVYDEVFRTNVRAVIQLTNLAAPHLIKTKGNIVNISSSSAYKVRVPGQAFYGSSKTCLNHFTKSAALELAPYGVRVNVVTPGPTETDMLDVFYNRDDGGKKAFNFEEVAALKRVLQAEEVGDLILYMASDKARGVTGSSYIIDNGVLLK